jgi:excisionase family DNA binding protein
MLKEEAELINVREASTLLSMSKSKIYEMLSTGELPSVRIGRAVRVPVKGLAAFVQNRHSWRS